MSEAYKSWSALDQVCFNPDGTMKEEIKQIKLSKGTTLAEIQSMEARKKQNIRQFEELEQRYLRDYGETFSAMTERRRRQSQSSAQLQKRQRLALDEGAELSELPQAVDPDEYYDYQARQVGVDLDDYTVRYLSGDSERNREREDDIPPLPPREYRNDF